MSSLVSRSTPRSSKRSEPRLTITLLGAPRADIDGRPVRTDTRKAIALLAYLAVTEGPQRRSTLAALFWPEAGSDKARAALRRTMSVLRTALDERWVMVDGENVSLDPNGLWVDVSEMRRAIARGRLADAVALYHGDFLQGFSLRDSPEFDEWQAVHSETLRADAGEALDHLASDAMATGDDAAAIAHLRHRLVLDPLHEPAHRALMRAYARSGDRAAALRQFHECARRLDAELGVAPSAETRTLLEAIERGTTLEEPAARPHVSTAEAVGDVHTLHGDYRRAIESYEAAAAKATASVRGAIEHKLAQVHHRRGDWPSAERHYKAAKAASGAIGEQSRILADWSLAAHRAGDRTRAKRLATEALTLAERSRDRRALAQAHNILGVLGGGTADARAHLETSAEIAADLGDREAHVAALNNLALAHRRSGDLEKARALTEAALSECESLGDRHRAAALHNNLADIYRALGAEADAMRHLKRAVRLFSDIGEASEPEIWKLIEW